MQDHPCITDLVPYIRVNPPPYVRQHFHIFQPLQAFGLFIPIYLSRCAQERLGGELATLLEVLESSLSSEKTNFLRLRSKLQ